jgi:hypothetical protein
MDVRSLLEAAEDIEGVFEAEEAGLIDVTPAGRQVLSELYDGIERWMNAAEAGQPLDG